MIPPDFYMPGIPRSIAEQPDMATVERIRESIGEDNGQTLRSALLKPCPFCGDDRPDIYAERECRRMCCATCSHSEPTELHRIDPMTGRDRADPACACSHRRRGHVCRPWNVCNGW